uniref:Uncharacterized protein n=1 Tax=Bursaphelenchus xylophilus TaxID=6326 RepID=A0A1I7SMY7_BURXY
MPSTPEKVRPAGRSTAAAV